MRSRRTALLTPLAVVLLGVIATASADARGSRSGAAPSTSPHVGEPLSSSTKDQLSLSAHLRARGAIFYGAWWCPACFKQKNLFGKEAGNNLPYVECDKTDQGREACVAAKIRAFPTWDLKGKSRLEGVQSLEELKAWSGYPSGASSALP